METFGDFYTKVLKTVQIIYACAKINRTYDSIEYVAWFNTKEKAENFRDEYNARNKDIHHVEVVKILVK